jgi:hypothetical protein
MCEGLDFRIAFRTRAKPTGLYSQEHQKKRRSHSGHSDSAYLELAVLPPLGERAESRWAEAGEHTPDSAAKQDDVNRPPELQGQVGSM